MFIWHFKINNVNGTKFKMNDTLVITTIIVAGTAANLHFSFLLSFYLFGHPYSVFLKVILYLSTLFSVTLIWVFKFGRRKKLL